MEESVGFEPTELLTQLSSFQNWCNRPTLPTLHTLADRPLAAKLHSHDLQNYLSAVSMINLRQSCKLPVVAEMRFELITWAYEAHGLTFPPLCYMIRQFLNFLSELPNTRLHFCLVSRPTIIHAVIS